MDTSGRRRNKRWPLALKREIVEATFLPGASVSVVARQYDVNANQVFAWRRRYLEAAEASVPAHSLPGLVPVTIAPEPECQKSAAPAPIQSDIIEIEVGGDCRVRVGSDFDARALKRVLDLLRK
ncbi:MAG: transposase [Hyphomicrobiaceae bacterium]